MASLKISIIYLIVVLNMVYCWPDFRLYTQKNPSKYVLVTDSLNGVAEFLENTETKFLIHGFSDSGETTGLRRIKDEILKKENVNVILVDWKEGAAPPNYFEAASNVKTTGARVAQFILKNQLNPKMIHCIGHSLGAHACGFIGKIVKLRRISGLDPAGPLFRSNPKENRLDKDDADLVDNIHTDYKYGIQESIGDKDFYPNGGARQPGCLTKRNADLIASIIACSHMRVLYYYAESVNSDCQFTSNLCTSYDDFQKNKCECDTTACSPMGYYADKTDTPGKYFLFLKSNSPYCKF